MLSRQQAIIWTSDGPVYWHIYASLGLNDLRIEWRSTKQDKQKKQKHYNLKQAVQKMLISYLN